MIFIKIFIILVLIIVFLEDYKDQMVHWFLYPIIGILGFCIQLEQSTFKLIVINSTVNLLFVIVLLSITYFYSRLILKRELMNQSMGIGDVLLFLFLCFTFSFVSFFVIFIFSLIFSLVLHQFLKNKTHSKESVPLAGYISLFFSAFYLASLIFNCNFLYAY